MISIVLITYNRPEYLKFAIEGILNQTYEDFELVVMDNGSDSSTAELLNSYKDKRIKLVRNDVNSRLFANQSFQYTNREYLLITHDDDIMKPNFLSRMLEEIVKGDYDLLGCAIEEIDSSGKSLNRISGNKMQGLYELNNKTPISEYLNQNFLDCPTIIFKSSFILQNNIKWDFLAGPAADADLILTCLILGGKVANLREHLYQYRVHENQDSRINMITMHLDLFSHWMRRRDLTLSKEEISWLHDIALKYIKNELRFSNAKYSNVKKSFNYLIASIGKVINLESIKYFYKTVVWLVRYKIKY